MIVKLQLLVWFALVALSVSGQNPVMVWVEFTDKDHSIYSTARPHEFLSVKALERRQNHKIPIDNNDLPVSFYYVDSLAKLTGYNLHYTSRWFNGAMFSVFDEPLVSLLDGIDFISRIEIAKRVITKSKTNPERGTMEHLSHTDVNKKNTIFPYSDQIIPDTYSEYGATEGQIKLLNGQSLHQQGLWGEGITIGVLDAGFKSVDSLEAFNDLWIYNRILGYYDFVQGKEELFNGHAHGTYVLSVMGASQPGAFGGVAPAASYWLLRTEDGASEFRVEEYNWLVGAEFADSVGVDIINSSLGYTTFNAPEQDYVYENLDGATTVVARAANIAFSKGILVVNSAGNYGTQTWQYIGSPADAHGVLAVGGTDASGVKASFSSVGPSADGRVKPQIMAQGQGVAVVNYLGGISNANGTSFSAPLISGMAACLWQKFPEATNSQVKHAIIKSADQYLNPDSLYGYGMPDFQKAAEILEKQIYETQFLKMSYNPLLPQSAISFYTYRNEEIFVEIFNSSGQLVWYREGIPVYPGYNVIKPFNDIDLLVSGMYLIRVNFTERIETIKALKF